MGSRILALAAGDPAFAVTAALEATGSPHRGRDAGTLAGLPPSGVLVSDRCDATFDVLIDFSSAAGTLRAMEWCVAAARPLVIGTTGHSQEQLARMSEAARRIAIVQSPNMSVGVNVMLRVVRELAAALGDEYDVEIIETHHRFKADAPSGTALALLESVRAGRGLVAPDADAASAAGAAAARVTHGRSGATGARPRGQIGVHAVRLGDTVGEHVVCFGALGETLSLRHEAHTRDTFAAGALRAATWIVSRPAGLYSMQDVLFG